MSCVLYTKAVARLPLRYLSCYLSFFFFFFFFMLFMCECVYCSQWLDVLIRRCLLTSKWSALTARWTD